MSIFSRIAAAIRGKEPVSIQHFNDKEIFIEAAARRGDKAPSKDLVKAAVSLRVQDIAKWQRAISLATDPEEPDRAPLLEIYDAIRRDLHLSSIIDTRIIRVQQSKFKINSAKSGEENEDLKKLFERSWFDKFIQVAINSLFDGSKVIELYELTEEGELAKLTPIPMQHVKPLKGMIVKEVGDDKGWLYKEGVFADYYMQIGEDLQLGMLADVAPIPLAKKFAIGTWMDYIEKYGISPRWVISPYGDAERQKELAKMMEAMHSAHYAVLQGDEKIEMADGKQADAYQVFNQFIERANSEMSKRILGATGTVDEKSFVGAANVHQDVADDRHESDKVFIKNLINTELIPKLMKLSNAYSGLAGHYFEWDDFNELDQKTVIDSAVKLSQYYELDIAYLSEKTGIPILGTKESIVPGSDNEDPQKKKLSPKAVIDLPKIEALYAQPCCGHTDELTFYAMDLSTWNKVIDKVARDLYNGKLKPQDLSDDIIQQTYSELSEAVGNGYNYDTTQFDYNSVERLKIMNANLYEFSGAKSFTELVAMNNKLLDENGKRRSFTDFKEQVKMINKQFNVNYLQAEYQTALKSAEMAKKWQGFERRKKLFPNLLYRTVGDDRVRESHAALEGLIRPIDDPIWDVIYPPNGFRDRCNVLSTDEQVTPGKDPVIDIPDAFQNNVAKTGAIFHKNRHAYWDIPSGSKINEGFRTALEMAKQKAPYFEAYKAKNGKKVLLSPFADKSGLAADIRCAKVIADSGNQVKLRPLIQFGHRTPKELKSKGITNIKNPEYDIDGVLADRKAIKTLNGIKRGIVDLKAKEAAIMVIDLDEHSNIWKNFDSFSFAKKLKGEGNRRDWFKGYWLVRDGMAIAIDRKLLDDFDKLEESIKKMSTK